MGDLAEEDDILLEPKGDRHEKAPEISLHTMEGSSSPRTIRLMRYVNKKPISILLDTGCTQFCVSQSGPEDWADSVSRAGFKVTLAGGDKLQSEGLSKEVQGVKIVADFHILPIGGCQMVLSVD